MKVKKIEVENAVEAVTSSQLSLKNTSFNFNIPKETLYLKTTESTRVRSFLIFSFEDAIASSIVSIANLALPMQK